MSENSEEKREIKLKGVIPAKRTTPEEFYRAIDDLREYRRRSIFPDAMLTEQEQQTKVINEFLACISEKVSLEKAFLMEMAKEHEKQTKVVTEFLANLAKSPSFMEMVKEPEKQAKIAFEIFLSFADYLAKNPSLIEEVMKEREEKDAGEETSSDS